MLVYGCLFFVLATVKFIMIFIRLFVSCDINQKFYNCFSVDHYIMYLYVIIRIVNVCKTCCFYQEETEHGMLFG